MDMTVVLGLHKFILQASIDHHGPYYVFWSLYCLYQPLQKTFYCNDSKITEVEIIDTQNSSTAYVVMYKLITYGSFDYSHGVGTSFPSH